MKIPEDWQMKYCPSGQIVAYHFTFDNYLTNGLQVGVVVKFLGFAMGCVKDDDSTITWDATAMEREKR